MTDIIVEVFAPVMAFVGIAVAVPLVVQWVNMVSQRMHASNLQTQVNDNTALNNTSIAGTAGNKEVEQTAKP